MSNQIFYQAIILWGLVNFFMLQRIESITFSQILITKDNILQYPTKILFSFQLIQ